MTRVLLMIFGAGLIVSAACFTGAFAIGGHGALTRGGWALGRSEWRHEKRDTGPEETRSFTWSGGERLEIDTAAEVRYVQASGPARLTITGPARILDDVVVEDGAIRLRGSHWTRRGLKVELTAPDVKRFEVNGSGDLDIRDFRQDSIAIDISGSGNAKVQGETRSAEVDISGSGEADLADLKTASARVDVSGSGHAAVAPTEAADLSVAGSGEIELRSRPARVETDISGSGSIHQEGGAPAAPAPPAAPARRA